MFNEPGNELIIKAKEVFEKNHGFLPSDEVFIELIACNTVADIYAGHIVDEADKALQG
ncbi:hypothetical protein D3C79_913200 [compost metagenome]